MQDVRQNTRLWGPEFGSDFQSPWQPLRIRGQSNRDQLSINILETIQQRLVGHKDSRERPKGFAQEIMFESAERHEAAWRVGVSKRGKDYQVRNVKLSSIVDVAWLSASCLSRPHIPLQMPPPPSLSRPCLTVMVKISLSLTFLTLEEAASNRGS